MRKAKFASPIFIDFLLNCQPWIFIHFELILNAKNYAFYFICWFSFFPSNTFFSKFFLRQTFCNFFRQFCPYFCFVLFIDFFFRQFFFPSIFFRHFFRIFVLLIDFFRQFFSLIFTDFQKMREDLVFWTNLKG